MGALIAFLVGTALGVAGAYAYFDAWRVWMRDEAAKWEEEVAREVKELRAQVARLVGVEKSTCCGDATHGCMGPPR